MRRQTRSRIHAATYRVVGEARFGHASGKTVRSPRRSTSDRKLAAAQGPRSHSGTRTRFGAPVVLVVDDTDDNVELFGAVLRREGFVVVTASDGAEALEVAAVERPSVVVMDLAMPHMDGFEAIRRLRLEPYGAAVHVIVVSAFADAASRARAREVGGDEFLAKPCHPQALVERVRAALAPTYEEAEPRTA